LATKEQDEKQIEPSRAGDPENTAATQEMSSKVSATAIGTWLLVAVYYFYQYALRSAPSVMMTQLTQAFGVNALGVYTIVGMF